MSQSAAIPEGSVVITPVQQYEQQQRMNDTLRDVVNKIDGLTTKFDHYQDDQSRRMDAIDGKDGEIVQLQRRVSSLERWRWIITGGVSALGTAGATAIWHVFSAKH